MTEQAGWTLSRFADEDAQDCRDLVRRVSGESELAAPAYQEWQFARSPQGAAIAALARESETGRLIGQVATVPMNVRLSGKVRTAGLCLEPVVDAARQDRGVSVGLLRDVCALSAEQGIAFTYGFPDRLVLPTFVKDAGFKDIGSVPLLVRPLNPERLALKTTGSRVLGRTASIARKIWRTPTSAPRQESPPGLEIAEVTSFDGSYAVFWDRVQHRFPVMRVRDPAYLNWRYVDVPAREYTAFAARSEGQVRGFTVVRAAPFGQFSAGLIVELLVEASAEGRAAGRLLIDRASSYFEERDVDLLAGLALRHADEFRLLRSKGFWVCPRFLEPRSFRLVVCCHDEEASPSRLAYELRNWFITMGDYDAA